MKKLGLFILYAFTASSLAVTCLSKIDNTLCQQITGSAGSSLLPIQISLHEPPFSYPDKNQTPDSLKHYSLMVLDSTSRYLVTLKPQIDSLFVKYTLLSVATGQRISPPNVSYDYVLNVMSSVSTVNQLAQEDLIGKISLLSTQVPIVTATVPGFSILATKFPFDTTLAILKVESNNGIIPEMYNPDTITIARYGIKFLFGRFPASATCCPQPVRIDFSLTAAPNNQNVIRFPNDATTLVTGGEFPFPQCSPPCTSYVSIDSSYKTHEYRFQAGNVTLFMKVMDGSKPDSINVRFDTASFFTAAIYEVHSTAKSSGKINLVFDKNFVIVNGIDNGKITIYDMSGKRLYFSVFSSKGARIPLPALLGVRVFVVKVTAEHNEFCIKKLFVD